jgi:DNA-binding MarR family transcriptional regulator
MTKSKKGSSARARTGTADDAKPRPERATALLATPKAAVKKSAPAAVGARRTADEVGGATKGAYRLEEQVGFRLRRAHQRASTIFNEVMGRFDVTPTQFAALAKLHDLGPVSQNQLGRLTAMDPATILGVVGRLVRQNLARARPAPEDQRLMIIELTVEGQAQVALMKALAGDVSRRTLAPLSPAEARQLNDLLGRLG